MTTVPLRLKRSSTVPDTGGSGSERVTRGGSRDDTPKKEGPRRGEARHWGKRGLPGLKGKGEGVEVPLEITG